MPAFGCDLKSINLAAFGRDWGLLACAWHWTGLAAPFLRTVLKRLSLSLSADLCIYSYWLSPLRQASRGKMIQSSELRWRLRHFKILTCPLLYTKKRTTKWLALPNIARSRNQHMFSRASATIELSNWLKSQFGSAIAFSVNLDGCNICSSFASSNVHENRILQFPWLNSHSWTFFGLFSVLLTLKGQ